MRSLVSKVLGIVLLLVVVEFGVRACVDWAASRAIESNTVRVGDVTVASGAVPTAFYYGILGGLSNGSITLHDIVSTPVNVSSLQVSSDELELSRWGLLSGEVKITGNAPYRIQVVLSPENLGDYLNTTVHMQAGYLSGIIDTHPMEVKPELKGRTIVLADERFTYEVPLPGTDILPCKPSGLAVGGGIAVSCESPTLPKVLADATG